MILCLPGAVRDLWESRDSGVVQLLVICRDSDPDPDPRILQTIRGSVVTCAKLSEPRSGGYRDALLLLTYKSNHVYVYTDPVPSRTLSDVPRI